MVRKKGIWLFKVLVKELCELNSRYLWKHSLKVFLNEKSSECCLELQLSNFYCQLL